MSSFRKDVAHEDSDEEESVFVAPEHVAHRPSVPILGARSGLVLDPEHVRRGRQTSNRDTRGQRLGGLYTCRSARGETVA